MRQNPRDQLLAEGEVLSFSIHPSTDERPFPSSGNRSKLSVAAHPGPRAEWSQSNGFLGQGCLLLFHHSLDSSPRLSTSRGFSVGGRWFSGSGFDCAIA